MDLYVGFCGGKTRFPSFRSPQSQEITIFHLRRIYAEGYKALDPVELELPEKLLFLIGSNGAGKSSTLQSLAFIQFFSTGKPTDFFLERGWNRLEVRSKTIEKDHNTLRYHLLFQDDDGAQILWQFAYGLGTEANIIEQMWHRIKDSDPIKLFSYSRRGSLKAQSGEETKGLTPAGSILSVMDPAAITLNHQAVREVVDWCSRITSLELLSPVAMRGNVRGSPRGIGTRGQRLSGFLATLDAKTKSRIVERLADFYPLEGLSTTRKNAGWIDLKIAEAFSIGPISAQHVSDGFLRLLALCAIPEFGNRSSLVLLDEIEDGIEPHILPRLIERIVKDSSAQFVMTSHSPLLVNFFDVEDIVLLTRDPSGRSNFTPLNDLEVVQKGSEYLGAGEIWANSGLATLNEQAVASRRARVPIGDSNLTSNFTDEWARAFMVNA